MSPCGAPLNPLSHNRRLVREATEQAECNCEGAGEIHCSTGEVVAISLTLLFEKVERRKLLLKKSLGETKMEVLGFCTKHPYCQKDHTPTVKRGGGGIVSVLTGKLVRI